MRVPKDTYILAIAILQVQSPNSSVGVGVGIGGQSTQKSWRSTPSGMFLEV